MGELKRQIENRLKQAAAYEVRVANPEIGFEHVLPGNHPLELWEQCKSVVVFAVAASHQSNNTYIGPYAPWQGQRNVGPVPLDIQSEEHAFDRVNRLFIASLTLKLTGLLQIEGYQFVVANASRGVPLLPQLKLMAYEAGIGVYGRSGVIIHPELGNRLRLGAVLTDAELAPDGRLEGFEPCEGCDLCIRLCPAQAFDPAKAYPESYSREKCVPKRAQIAARGYYCHNCFAVCPAGEFADEELLKYAEVPSFYKPHRD